MNTTEKKADGKSEIPDLVCLSHLRWDFVYQRPQHLMTRFARQRRVFYIEEPVFTDGEPHIEASARDCGVEVVVPHIPGCDKPATTPLVQGLMQQFFLERQITSYGLWYYTPMALSWLRDPTPSFVVYDCMDELSGFHNAPIEIKQQEAELIRTADLMFTGGHHLFEAKRQLHSNIYPFPSSIDVTHFARARTVLPEPSDQVSIPHPRLGFFGVIDERMDLDLVAKIAQARPDWHIVILGPVVKIDPSKLPALDNIHYLGMKSYEELPSYIAGWDVALLPFAHNSATEFISPTKTPEYLAAGRPVVSTSIRDVVRPYGESGVVYIADEPITFIEAIEAALAEDTPTRLHKVDALLSQTSWARTWGRMAELVDDTVRQRNAGPLRAMSVAANTRVW